jgi:heme oxygenase
LLRSATAADHADVDRRFSALIAQGHSGYSEFLRRSAAAIGPLERALVDGCVEAVLPDWQERSRAAALREDLADLDLAWPAETGQQPLTGEALQFGVLYVLEGSRLGAKVLVRRLLGGPNRPAHPVRYLRHGEGRPFWQTFLKRLEASVAVRRAPAEAIAGARTAFARFGAEGIDRSAGAGVSA